MTNTTLKKCIPLAVWSSSLQSLDDRQTAIVADVEFMHSNLVVQNCVVVYSSAVQYFLNNPQNISLVGIELAFNMAYDLASTTLIEAIELGNKSLSALTFLNQARELANEADKMGMQGVNFLQSKYDAHAEESSISHAFVLSFFWLL